MTKTPMTRYKQRGNDGGMYEHPDGEWCLYAEAVSEINQRINEVADEASGVASVLGVELAKAKAADADARDQQRVAEIERLTKERDRARELVDRLLTKQDKAISNSLARQIVLRTKLETAKARIAALESACRMLEAAALR